MAAIPLALLLVRTEYLPRVATLPDKPSILGMRLAMGLMAGFFEELGWTGYVILVPEASASITGVV